MARNWYRKSMPTVGHVKPFVLGIAKAVKEINGVKQVLAWGQFVKHANEPNFVLKAIDIIAVNDFLSDDLLSIIEDRGNAFNLSKESLEDQGFSPEAINFTKRFIAFKKYNVDHWAISSNKKLLHWGPTPDRKDEWENIKKEAEDYAGFMTGNDRKSLFKKSQTAKNKWSLLYEHHINHALAGMPYGWYECDDDIEIVLAESIDPTNPH